MSTPLSSYARTTNRLGVTAMNSKIVVPLVAVLLFSGLLMASTAPTYTYTGNDFSSFVGSWPTFSTSDSIHGSFTFSSPLTDNMALTNEAGNPELTSFSFTDDTKVYDLSTVQVLYLGTDSSGSIDQWFIWATDGTSRILINNTALYNVEDSSCPTTNHPLGCYPYEITYSPGTWTTSNAVAPEPSSVLLLAAGLTSALATVTRRSLKRRRA